MRLLNDVSGDRSSTCKMAQNWYSLVNNIRAYPSLTTRYSLWSLQDKGSLYINWCTYTLQKEYPEMPWCIGIYQNNDIRNARYLHNQFPENGDLNCLVLKDTQMCSYNDIHFRIFLSSRLNQCPYINHEGHWQIYQMAYTVYTNFILLHSPSQCKFDGLSWGMDLDIRDIRLHGRTERIATS